MDGIALTKVGCTKVALSSWVIFVLGPREMGESE
jgi:hypothetical protein